MTRREFLSGFLFAAAAQPQPRDSITVPVHLILDGKVSWTPQQALRFWGYLWPEAVRTFAASGIRFDLTRGEGDVMRPPGREPVITGLVSGALNVVATNRVPMQWDSARGLSGVTMIYRGYHLSMIAVNRAQTNRVPFLSVNTCVHEMLHALLLDIFEKRPSGFAGQAREFRVDACATRLWLWHDDGTGRKAAREYVERLRRSTKPILRP